MTAVSPPSIKQRIISVSKWVWMLIVLIGLVIYVRQNFENIQAQLQLVAPSAVIISIILLALGRLFIMIMVRYVLIFVGHKQPFSNIFYMVATSDIAKYLPGGIWHFVGRAGYYRAVELPLSSITKAMFQENLWLIVSSGMTGIILFLLGYEVGWWIAVIITIWSAIIYLWGRQIALLQIISVVGVQLLIWVSIGLSFAFLLPHSLTLSEIAIVVGAFSISWLIGFISLFAPGGIGVRETVLVGLLLPILTSIDSSVFALIHRVLWISVEFFFAIVAWVFFDLNRP